MRLRDPCGSQASNWHQASRDACFFVFFSSEDGRQVEILYPGQPTSKRGGQQKHKWQFTRAGSGETNDTGDTGNKRRTSSRPDAKATITALSTAQIQQKLTSAVPSRTISDHPNESSHVIETSAQGPPLYH